MTPMAASSWRRRRCSSTGGCPVPGDESLFRLMEKLAQQCADLALEPDAGIWEFRGRKRVHTHSAAMCWAGISRTARHRRAAGAFGTGRALERPGGLHRRDLAEACAGTKSARPSRRREGTDDMDASVLLLPELGLIDAHDPRFASTVAAIEQDLVRGRHVMRYAAEDDFGLPETEFLVCRFWLIDALGRAGPARGSARALPGRAVAAQQLRTAGRGHPSANRRAVGQFSPDLFHGGGDPQRHAACQSWEDRYWRASS